MQIVHPPDLVTVVHQEMKDPGLPYAIFVMDNHSSHTAQQNTARLYEHYSRNNGLVLVGYENIQDLFLPAEEPLSKSFELRLGREITNSEEMEYINKIISPNLEGNLIENHSSSYVKLIAAWFGYELDLFNTSPKLLQKLNKIQGKDKLRGLIGKYIPRLGISSEEVVRRFIHNVSSPEISYGMLEIFMQRLEQSGREIAMFVSGMEHIEDIKERLLLLPINYAIISPIGVDSMSHWLQEMYMEGLRSELKLK